MSAREIFGHVLLGALVAAVAFGGSYYALLGLKAPFCIAWRWPLP